MTDPSSARTRRRILDAAASVFAERGFRAATIREICSRAEANLAAVNYHFRDKDGLYASVLEQGLADSLERYPAEGDAGPDASPEDRLRGFIHAFLMRLLGNAKDNAVSQLIAREMIEPTGAMEHVVKVHIGPMSRRITAIVSEILGRTSETGSDPFHPRLKRGSDPIFSKSTKMFGKTHSDLDFEKTADKTGSDPVSSGFEKAADPVLHSGPLFHPDPVVQRAAMSIVGQCVFYKHCAPVIARLFPQEHTRESIAALAEHIYTFSLGGLLAIKRETSTLRKRGKK